MPLGPDITTYIEALREGGLSEQDAMTHAKALVAFASETFATKADIEVLRIELRENVLRLEREIHHVRDTLRSEAATGRDLLRAEMQALEHRMTVKLGGMIAAGIGLLAVVEVLLK